MAQSNKKFLRRFFKKRPLSVTCVENQFINRSCLLEQQTNKGTITMWHKPVMTEICIGAEINSYVSARR
ncbi:pyrroloquinoline quinone precursor peptide PqqA [Acidocella sp.]|uniref:pyrroloquinoline quinone precursor peptide PqqA n=1 Tax=Acidocella sp. TaxID=50710 RepID=UPI0038CFF628